MVMEGFAVLWGAGFIAADMVSRLGGRLGG
jgi:hypothetical protein